MYTVATLSAECERILKNGSIATLRVRTHHGGLERGCGRFGVAAPGLAGPGAERRAQQPGEPLLAGAPEVLDVVVRPARQVGGDPRPLVPELRLQLDHHTLLVRRELAATSAKKCQVAIALPL